VYHVVDHDSDRGFVLKAGIAHGICVGAEFTVYETEEQLLLGPILGVLVVHSVSPFDSIMVVPPSHGPFALQIPAVAIQSKAGKDQELKLYVPLEEAYLSVFKAALLHMQGTGLNPRTIALVDNRSVATLAAVLQEEKITFDICDPRIKEGGMLPIPHAVNPKVKDVLEVLEAAEHYFYHLKRVQKNALVDEHVTVHLFKLEYSKTLTNEATGGHVRLPSGNDIIVDKQIFLDVCEHLDYGFCIKNNSTRDLFPNVFYFNDSDLSIGESHYSGFFGTSR
jgi:hypothetical protein